ncbi:hypothetical protein HYV80_06570 [Candidatus Woesearchaeota archaeon]|nr:hypothetical protein [Candidatus Woesearchaeota archaeon]
MKELKIMMLLKREYSMYYEIKHYKPQPAVQMAVRKYTIHNKRIVVG